FGLSGAPGDDDRVPLLHHRGGGGVGEALARPLDRHHRDAVPGAYVAAAQGQSHDVGRCARLDHGEVVFELDVVQHAAAHQMGDALPHVVLGVDDMVGADLGEDTAVRLTGGLGPHVVDAEGNEQGSRQNAGFQIGADADDGTVELV